jgi:hypothetical protein
LGARRENHVRYVILSILGAVLLGYDFIYLNGYYVRLIIRESAATWQSIENFVVSLF